MPINTEKTGTAIAAHRQRMHMSQQGLAGLMNVTHQAVSKWEKGLALPDTETLLALAKLFGTTMEDLLMGRLPKEPEATEETVNVQEPVSVQGNEKEEQAASIPTAELEYLDFSSVRNMLPFVSTKVADQLFRVCAKNAQLDAGALSSIAPFVSTRTLADYVSAHSFKADSPEVLACLAPFLPAKAVDEMILSMEAPLPPHVAQMLMPFASTHVVDQMVMGKLGIEAEQTGDHSSDYSMRLQDKIHQKIRRKLDALEDKTSDHPLSSNARQAAAPAEKRESPRTRLIRKAIENGSYDFIENCFDELDADAHRLLLKELAGTGDAKLLSLFCESAGELEANEQFELVQILVQGRLYSELAEVLDELEDDVQHQLIDHAFELNDPELLHIISEHL